MHEGKKCRGVKYVAGEVSFGSGASVSGGESVAVLLNAAQNGIFRALRAHGSSRDPMGRVFRKVDDFLLTALAGVYVIGLVRQS